MIIRNAIRCNLCGDEIESKTVHDFGWCKCPDTQKPPPELGGGFFTAVFLRYCHRRFCLW